MVTMDRESELKASTSEERENEADGRAEERNKGTENLINVN